MALEIVWRNLLPLAKPEIRVRRVTLDNFGAIYVVCSSNVTEEFELILGGAA